MGGIDDADPRRRLSMLGYWSVSQRNILGMPCRAVFDDDAGVVDMIGLIGCLMGENDVDGPSS